MSEHTAEPWQLFGVDLHIMGNTLEQAKEQGVPHAASLPALISARASQLNCLNPLLNLITQAIMQSGSRHIRYSIWLKSATIY
jgi:hypothetical protein